MRQYLSEDRQEKLSRLYEIQGRTESALYWANKKRQADRAKILRNRLDSIEGAIVDVTEYCWPSPDHWER